MKLKGVLVFLLVLVFATSTLLSGCDFSRDSDKDSSPDKKDSSKITVNIVEEPPELNSTITTDTTSFTVLRHVIEGLVNLDKNDEPIPGVAKEWEESEDGLTYTFHLREDSKWSNGDSVTANDFEFGLKKVLEKENASQYAYILFMIENAEKYNLGEVEADKVGINAIDDYTLEFKLNAPTPYFVSLMAFGVCKPVNEKFYKESGDKYGTEADKLIFNAGWTLEEWEHDSKLILKKNEDYWNKDTVKIDEIEFLTISDYDAAFNSILAGEMDLTDIEADKVETAEEKGLEVQEFSDGATEYLQFNFEDKLMSNKKIRQAISMSVNRDEMAEYVLKGVFEPAYSYTTPAINGLNEKSFSDEVGELGGEFNPDEAKKLWNEGLKELGMEDVTEIDLLTGDNSAAKRDGEALQEYISKALDVDVKITGVPFKDRLDKMDEGNFQVVLALWGPDYNDPLTFLDMFESSGGNNHGKYSSKTYDENVKKVKSETDLKKRYEIYKEIESEIAEELPVASLFFRNKTYIQDKNITGVIRTAFQDMNFYEAEIK